MSIKFGKCMHQLMLTMFVTIIHFA